MKTGHGCWTCKKRKIGCDRALPVCRNCTRTGRQCLGYGIRLVWPDRPDGRRRLPDLPPLPPQPLSQIQGELAAYYGRHFLNVTADDVTLSKLENAALSRVLLPPPPRTISFNADLHHNGSQLLSYYETTLARMISTVDGNNGFRHELLPMALSPLSSSANTETGLLNAMMAVAAVHSAGRNAALPFKTKAIRQLSSSFEQETSSLATVKAQLATAMMLCVYNVFDPLEGNWHLHLSGARDLLLRAADMQSGRLECNFLYTWFLYHEVLGAFSQAPQRRRNKVLSLELIRDSQFDESVIVGSLGCSVEVFEIIHHINGLRPAPISDAQSSQGSRSPETPSDNTFAYNLQKRLINLTQRLDTVDFDSHTPKQRTKIMTTAELYRIAAILYLRQVCPHVGPPSEVSLYMEQAFELLGNLEVCTSPWPLFVIACQAEYDEQRIVLIQTLDRMDEERNIGNVIVLRGLIETYWKHRDLQLDSDRAKGIKWWELINFEDAAPWFI